MWSIHSPYTNHDAFAKRMMQLVHPFYKEGIMGVSPFISYKRALGDKNSLVGFLFPMGKRHTPENAIGFIHVIRRKLKGSLSKISPPFYQIKQVLVGKDNQRAGAGTALVKWVLSRADSLPIMAQVMPFNKSAISFYKKRGFSLKETILCGKNKDRKEYILVKSAKSA